MMLTMLTALLYQSFDVSGKDHHGNPQITPYLNGVGVNVAVNSNDPVGVAVAVGVLTTIGVGKGKGVKVG